MNKLLEYGIGATALLSACATGPVGDAPVNDENVKPQGTNLNFLILMADQVQWKALGCSGNPAIKTPALDAMAARGAYFSEAVCPVPVSGPSRSCMLTGRLMEKTKIYDNNLASKGTSRYKSYDNILAEHGYYVEFIGKFHSPLNMADIYRNPERYGMRGRTLIEYWERLYRYWLSENQEAVSIQPGEKLLSEGFYNHIPYEPNMLDKRYEKLMSGAYTPLELKGIKTSQPDCHGTLQLDDDKSITAFQGREAIAALKRAKGRKFSITCSFHSPHAPMLPTPGFRSMYDPDSMPVPASIHDDMSCNPYRKGNGRLDLSEYSDEKKIRLMTADYYALVSEVDHWVGEILKTLKAEGLDRNTVVIFLSDHGEMLGAHGMREKNNFMEESVRVPFIIDSPDMTSGITVDHVVSTGNLYQTIMDYAGIESESDGFSLRPLTRGGDPEYDFAISEWTRSSKGIPNLMIKTKKWKLMLNIENLSGNADALYDMENDPDEMHNLICGKPAGQYIPVCRELTGNLIGYLSARDYPLMKELRAKYNSFR